MATPTTPTQTLAGLLDSLTRPGELYEPLGEGKVRCYACGHRCVIFDGHRGICRVRFNRGGTLHVPWGYAAALQRDPTEKKPFFHVLPGSYTLTFGMLGCDFHCSYCFPGETPVVTDRGVFSIEVLFAEAHERTATGDAEIAFLEGWKTVTGQGELRPIRKVFKHFYSGDLCVISPLYLPPIRCTPEHRIFVTIDPLGESVEAVEARFLSSKYFLLVPKPRVPSKSVTLDVSKILAGITPTFKLPRNLSPEEVSEITSASANGLSSKALGASFGLDPSHIRHVRSKVRRGVRVYERIRGLIEEEERVRFFKEKGPGIPRLLSLDKPLARLLGYYCAEGSAQKSKNRPNSLTLTFSFGPKEIEQREEVKSLLEHVFQVKAREVSRDTTIAVEIGKSSLSLLFTALCGSRAREKRVPAALLFADPAVVEEFLDAYLRGDGHTYQNGKVSVTTVSYSLAYEIAWLALRLGFLPSVYETPMSPEGQVQGRTVRRTPVQYTVVWYKNSSVPRKYRETEHYYLIPIRSVSTEPFSGVIYNLEVEDHHSYLAGFFAAKNCQNWISSQALRDPVAGVEPIEITPEQMVRLAKRGGAQVVGSSYNEPLITSEWSVSIFRLAKEQGLKTLYVSNGNATREVLEYLRPWCDCYKIDLKTMNDRNYRFLGGTLESVLNTIKMTYEMGFWVEVVTLVIPGWNDSDQELRAAAEFIASVSPDIPWHVTAFHKDYKMTDPDNTSPETLLRAARIGQEAGLHYVYAGNLPGMVGEYENTYCPHCKTLLIRRYGYHIALNRLSPHGKCPTCGATIPGIWN